MTRFIGIDYGTRRIGFAVGDTTTMIASPVSRIESPACRAQIIRAAMNVGDEYAAEAFVIGLPINMDGTEGSQARLVRDFGLALAGATDKAVHYFDERLSTRAADELLRPAELTRGKKKERRDAVAAQVMLAAFLATAPDEPPANRDDPHQERAEPAGEP